MDKYEEAYAGKSEPKSKKKEPKPVPVLTPKLLEEIKQRFEYGILPPDHWASYRTIHSLVEFIEKSGLLKPQQPFPAYDEEIVQDAIDKVFAEEAEQ